MRIRLLENVRRSEVQGARGDIVEVQDALGRELEKHGVATFFRSREMSEQEALAHPRHVEAIAWLESHGWRPIVALRVFERESEDILFEMDREKIYGRLERGTDRWHR